VFGGSVGGLVPRNDWTWLNLDTMECGSILQPAGSTADQWPEPRFLHAAHLIPGTANIMIYGGLRRIDDNARLADVWVYDTAAGTWEGPFRDGIPPIKLWGSYSSVGENLVIYGGTAGFDLFTLFTTAINLTDNYLERDSILVFKYDGTLREKIAWRYLSTDTISGGIRPARFAHSSTTFPDQRGIFVTGGFDVAPRVDSHRGQSGDIWFGANFVYFFTGCYKGYQPSQPGDPFAKCSPCQPGHYQDTAPLSSAIQLDVELIPQCLPCPAGEYASEIASIECMLVPDGYYSLGGASAPSPCPSDRPYTNLLGATSDSACTNVKAGADNVGAIVGGVVGAVVALAAIGAVVGGIFYRRYKKLKENAAFVAPIVIDETAFNISFLKRSDLELGDELGQGSFGTVYKGLYKDREVACKVSKPGMNEAVEDFLREAEVMMQIDPHPNVLQLIGVCVAGGSAMVVLEYVDSGSLKTLLNEGYTFEESELKDLIYQIGSGLQHVHGNKLIHRDLAARNILLAKTGASGYVFKISDFGMSRVVEGEQQQGNTATTLGPVPWMAPEAIANLEYSPASDAWSFGVLIWEVVTGLDPAQQMPMVDLAVAIRDRGYHPRIPPFIPEYLQTILRGLWTVDAKKRMTIQQVLKILENASGGAAPKGGASSSGYANAGGVMSPGTTPMAALKTPQAALPGSKKDDPRARSKFESSSLQAKVETLERKLADASAENEHLRTMLVQAGVLQSKNSPVPGYSGIADTDKTKKSKKSNKKKGKTETNYESIEMAPMAEKPQPQPQQQQPPQQELGASVFGRDWRKSFVPGQLSNV
jgi:serine/threonine protein kinase